MTAEAKMARPPQYIERSLNTFELIFGQHRMVLIQKANKRWTLSNSNITIGVWRKGHYKMLPKTYDSLLEIELEFTQLRGLSQALSKQNYSGQPMSTQLH